MLGSRSRVEPAPACDLSAAQEASQLELQLQRQLEEDVARIFDESIYSDVEVVCGKLKILTHSCILKARTNNFYHKLETILHVNIGRNTFDEIYSFVSDVYTECNIKHQEDEIIAYLDDNLDDKSIVLNSNSTDIRGKKNEIEDSDVFLTPKCASPYVEKDLPKALNASPSTEITKEYYALVPIDGNLLEKELIEQDALSNAFQSIFKIQCDDLNKIKSIQRNKPTSLSLNSSHLSKIVKHSNSCDILNDHRKDNILQSNEIQINNLINNQEFDNSDKSAKKASGEAVTERFGDLTYSPDSLITDDPSSSSDYLSAAYICSPGVNSSGGISLINIDEDNTKMENIFTSSDSGLENTGLLESLSSHKDVTLTDISLTESTLHELTSDDSKDLVSSSATDKNKHKFKNNFQPTASCTTTSENGHSNVDIGLRETSNCRSSKEEKQRQNEEIVILESSSLSSETGSWESVFPPLLAQKEPREKNISNDQQLPVEETSKLPNKDVQNFKEDLCPSLVQKSPFKSTLCFIDAACLADEEDTINVQIDTNETSDKIVTSDLFPAPSQPVPCSTAKLDSSPNDLSESNDNDDSLEQGDNKDPDSIQKDLSPTIFDMTPITEDSLCANFENALQTETTKEQSKEMKHVPDTTSETATSILSNSSVFVSTTPHNSIMSLKCSGPKQYESEESESDTTIVGREGNTVLKKNIMKFYESSPIVSGGASMEDHLPKISSINGSPATRRKVENIPIVCGAFVNQSEDHTFNKSPKPSCPPAWVVDMSCDKHDSLKNSSTSLTMSTTKPCDKSCDYVKTSSKVSLDSIRSFENVNKSRSSVDSDGSEKSSHKFYIDLASLPDPIPPKKHSESENSEKKNIFSMYIDLGKNVNVKEMPARLNSRKPVVDAKSTSKSNKHVKNISSECSSAASTKNVDIVTSTCTFEKYESLCNDPNINISEIIHIADRDDISDEKLHCETKNEKSETTSSCLPGNKSQQRHKKPSVKDDSVISEPTNLFVKLSDLDKPIQKLETIAVITEEKVLDIRMTRSIPENNWGDHNNPSSLRSMEVISSFHSENALSLNRLFPHLKNEFSRSMPGSLSGRTRSSLRLGTSSSPGDLEEQASDMSEISSVQSSICRSVIEHSTTEETSQTSSLIGNCQSRLGQDLLRMFLEEIAPDVIVEVSGRRIKAHKCILSSRCQYFAGILSGGWVESAGNVIVLPPFSFNVVHFALCHIYSGVSTIPDSISIVELATIADMLGLEGLKEAIMFTLKAKYCHHFHRPCQVCTAGVLECFPLSSVYGLDDLYRKCLKWITKYFSKVWPTKAFATLPKELLDKCYQQHIINLSTDSLADTVYGCGITVASLQNSRWAESVARMCRRLVNAAAHYAAPRLTAVLRAIAPLPPDAPPPAKQALDDCLAAALEWAPPDEACRAYAYLSALVKDLRSQNYAKPDLISNGNQNKTPGQHNLLYTDACSWRMQCEGALVRAAPRVVGTQAFKELPVDLRKRLRELGCIMYGAQAVPITSSPLQDRKCRSTYHKSKSTSQNSSTTRSLDIDHVRASFVPYAPKPAAQISSALLLKSNNDLIEKKIKGTNPPKIRTTKAQEERAKFNLSKNNQSQDRLHNKSNPMRLSFENTKPRYLEPKIIKDGEKRIYAAQKNIPKIISSSESSRNSSPIQARRRQQANASKVQAMSQDSLATSSRPRTAEPSTDSLSESQTSNKYATYTKTKHTTKGSIESVNSSQYQNAQQKSTNHKLKTKIPVYLNQGAKRLPRSSKVVTDLKNVANSTRARTNERKETRSLMSATQSSSAKMVPKIKKEPISNKSTPKCTKKPAGNVKGHSEVTKPPDIPVMERSGTFLKDEPTFGDKTTKIDIDEK